MRAVALALLIAGCNGSLFGSQRPAEPPDEWFNGRWSGQSRDEILLHYGPDFTAMKLSNGNEVLSYHREVATASSRSAYTQYGGGSRSNSTTIYCDRRFEIDRDTQRVVRAVITGSNCDYSR